MPKIISSFLKSLTDKEALLLPLYFVIIVAAGCEKSKAPFSSNISQPSQSTAKIYVIDGSSPAANVTIKGTDPSGNIFTTVSDSDGYAIFNPIPFNSGKWIFQMPNQNNRCFGNVSASTSILSGVTSQAVTFQYGVPVNISSSTSGTGSASAVTISYSFTLITQNDCGIPWTFSVNVKGSDIVWSLGGSGGFAPSSTHSVSLTSGQSVNLTIVQQLIPGSGISNISLALESIFGQTNDASTTF